MKETMMVIEMDPREHRGGKPKEVNLKKDL